MKQDREREIFRIHSRTVLGQEEMQVNRVQRVVLRTLPLYKPAKSGKLLLGFLWSSLLLKSKLPVFIMELELLMIALWQCYTSLQELRNCLRPRRIKKLYEYKTRSEKLYASSNLNTKLL